MVPIKGEREHLGVGVGVDPAQVNAVRVLVRSPTTVPEGRTTIAVLVGNSDASVR